MISLFIFYKLDKYLSVFMYINTSNKKHSCITYYFRVIESGYLQGANPDILQYLLLGYSQATSLFPGNMPYSSEFNIFTVSE